MYREQYIIFAAARNLTVPNDKGEKKFLRFRRKNKLIRKLAETVRQAVIQTEVYAGSRALDGIQRRKLWII